MEKEGERPERLARAHDDRSGKSPANAVVTFGGVVQPVPRNQRSRRQAGVDRTSHQREAGKQANLLLSRTVSYDSLHD